MDLELFIALQRILQMMPMNFGGVVVQKPCRIGVNKYFQGAALMRECKTKYFFGGAA